MIANTYVLHLSCPVCGGVLYHVAAIPADDLGVVGAWAECRHCDTDVSITVEMTYKQRSHRHGPPLKNRLPLEPLMSCMGCAGPSEFAALVGLPRLVVQRLRREGVTIARADALAVMCGLNPASVWGDASFQALEAER